MRSTYISLHRSEEHDVDGRARGFHFENRRGSDLLLPSAWALYSGRGEYDCERLLQGSLPPTPNGVRGGSAKTPGRESRRERRLMNTSNPANHSGMLIIDNLSAAIDG